MRLLCALDVCHLEVEPFHAPGLFVVLQIGQARLERLNAIAIPNPVSDTFKARTLTLFKANAKS